MKLVKILGIFILIVTLGIGINAEDDDDEDDDDNYVITYKTNSYDSLNRLTNVVEFYDAAKTNMKKTTDYNYFVTKKFNNLKKESLAYVYSTNGIKNKYKNTIFTTHFDVNNAKWITKEYKDTTIYYYSTSSTKVYEKYSLTTHNLVYKSKIERTTSGKKLNALKTNYKNNKITSRYYYDYNSKGELKSTTTSKAYRIKYVYSNGKLSQTIKQYFDSKGNLKSATTVNSGTTTPDTNTGATAN